MVYRRVAKQAAGRVRRVARRIDGEREEGLKRDRRTR